ncbi:MAG: 5'-methylthioadenosine/adenosylhomocysteine nucleosidase [Rikenellaceae bacterium]
MIGIVVAMSREAELIKNQMESISSESHAGMLFTCGSLAGREVVLAQSGIGKVCAAVGISEMISRYNPSHIINSGVAGGLSDTLRVMDIVAGSQTTYHDTWCGEGNAWGQVQGYPAKYEADEELLNIATTLPGVKCGLICSGDRFITSAEELAPIKEAFAEVLAVDMESNAMAQVCYMYGVKFLSLRIISDIPGSENHNELYEDFWATAPEHTFAAVKEIIKKIA